MRSFGCSPNLVEDAFCQVHQTSGEHRTLTYFTKATDWRTHLRDASLRSGWPGGGRRIGVSAVLADFMASCFRPPGDRPGRAGPLQRTQKGTRCTCIRAALVRRSAPKTSTPRFVGTEFSELRGVRLGAGGVPPAGSGEDFRVHQARVEAHQVDPGIHGDPVRDAAALTTAVGLEGPVAPHVDVGGRVGGENAHPLGRVVGSQGAVPPAYRAVAIHHLHRW